MARTVIHVAGAFTPMFQEIGFAPAMVFDNAIVKPWRRLPDRENCTWDFVFHGKAVRLHVKRFPPQRGMKTAAEEESLGYRALEIEKIPTAALVAWGVLEDRHSFLITEDLAGYEAADKLVEAGTAFDRLLAPTAAIAAQLHKAKLHHRDLYLCHFLAKLDDSAVDVRLIDAARVRPLPGIFVRRWIVKDLAQFWYSTTKLNITDAQRNQWLAEYGRQAETEITSGLRDAIIGKSDWISRHDRNLRQKQPTRNISIPPVPKVF